MQIVLFFSKTLSSFKFAFNGIYRLAKSERNFKIHLTASLLVTLAGIYFKISTTEWLAQCIIIGMVLSLEALNTAIEHLANYVQPKKDEKIALIKDIAAGGVLIVAIIAIIIANLIYIPKIMT